MGLAAVLTGDMIASKTLSTAEREKFIMLLSNLEDFFGCYYSINSEIFRGDSFQIKIEDPLDALKAAVLIRALFRSQSYQGSSQQWDCRISVGIGHTEFEKSRPGVSDGEVYRLSGYGLDQMKTERLVIATPWREINDETRVTTAFADDIISDWTIKQSHVIVSKLRQGLSNAQTAVLMQVSRQAVDKLVNAAKLNLIELYLKRFQQILTDKL